MSKSSDYYTTQEHRKRSELHFKIKKDLLIKIDYGKRKV